MLFTSSSQACRKETRCERITQSITAPAGITPEAVPQIGLRRDDAARGVIPLVPGTAAGQILALTHETMPLALDQPRKTHLALQALQLSVRDARHRLLPPKPVKPPGGIFNCQAEYSY